MAWMGSDGIRGKTLVDVGVVTYDVRTQMKWLLLCSEIEVLVIPFISKWSVAHDGCLQVSPQYAPRFAYLKQTVSFIPVNKCSAAAGD